MLRKGLKQIETLLAELCLPNYKACQSSRILLEQIVGSDPALTEFIRLQNNFEYNGMAVDSG